MISTPAPPEPIQPEPPGPAMQQPLPPDGSLDLLSYARILLSYWWILAPLAVLGGAAGMFYCYYVPPLYRAVCRYEIFQNRMLKVTDVPDQDSGRGWQRNPLDRQIILLKSKNLNRKIMVELKKKWDVEDATNVLQKFKLDVRPVKGANDEMVDISVDSFDGRFSQEYIEALLTGFNELRLQETAQVHEETIQGLKQEEQRLSTELDDIQGQIADFEAANNVDFLSKKKSSEEEHLVQILAKQREINTQRTILESQFPFLTDANVATLTDVFDLTVFSTGGVSRNPGETVNAPGWSEIPEWRDNEAEIVRLEAEYEFLRKTFKPVHPKLIALRNKIERARAELKTAGQLALDRLKARREALAMQEKALLEVAENKQTGVELAHEETARYEKLKARAKHIAALHDKVYGRMIDASTGNKDRYFTRAVEGPYIISQPVWPNKPRSVAMGMLACLAVGSGLVLLRFLRQARLYDLDVIERTTGLACLAIIPEAPSRKAKKDPLFLNSLPKSNSMCEAYRLLRTAIERRQEADPLVALVTSPGPGDGKTFTVVNMANIFAWNNKRVLVVDGDLRRTTLRKSFGVTGEAKGLVEYLKKDDLDWRELIIKEVAPNVDFLPAGKPTESGAELLGSGSLDDLFREARGMYDLILVDSSPATHVVDAVLMAKHADAVVLVTRLGKTSPQSARHAMERLEGIPMLGFVQNYVTQASRKYGAYYGGYYGGYYKGYGYYGGYRRSGYYAYNNEYTNR